MVLTSHDAVSSLPNISGKKPTSFLFKAWVSRTHALAKRIHPTPLYAHLSITDTLCFILKYFQSQGRSHHMERYAVFKWPC